MEKRCILTIGVSASGKTYWAENFVATMTNAGNDECWLNINRDDLREHVYFLHTNSTVFSWTDWKWKWEKEVTKLWHEQIEQTLANPKVTGVVISDTNLNPKVRAWLTETFRQAGYTVEERIFPVSFEEAIRRDRMRSCPVGFSVIAEQMEKYCKQYGNQYVPNPDLPKAVIFDVDGTLAHITDRKIFDFSAVHTDRPDEVVCAMAKGFKKQGYKIIVVSGRDDSCFGLTLEWLCTHLGFLPDGLFMRKTKDSRRDCIIKGEIFRLHIEPGYHVVAAVDDRPQVITELWMPLGIKTISVGNPYIFF